MSCSGLRRCIGVSKQQPRPASLRSVAGLKIASLPGRRGVLAVFGRHGSASNIRRSPTRLVSDKASDIEATGARQPCSPAISAGLPQHGGGSLTRRGAEAHGSKSGHVAEGARRHDRPRSQPIGATKVAPIGRAPEREKRLSGWKRPSHSFKEATVNVAARPIPEPAGPRSGHGQEPASRLKRLHAIERLPEFRGAARGRPSGYQETTRSPISISTSRNSSARSSERGGKVQLVAAPRPEGRGRETILFGSCRQRRRPKTCDQGQGR